MNFLLLHFLPESICQHLPFLLKANDYCVIVFYYIANDYHSVGGIIYSPKRNRLKGKNNEMLMFLHYNLRILGLEYK